MAKKSLQYNLTGILDFNGMTVTVFKKDEETVYDLSKMLEQFHGTEVALTLKNSTNLEEEDELVIG